MLAASPCVPARKKEVAFACKSAFFFSRLVPLFFELFLLEAAGVNGRAHGVRSRPKPKDRFSWLMRSRGRAACLGCAVSLRSRGVVSQHPLLLEHLDTLLGV